MEQNKKKWTWWKILLAVFAVLYAVSFIKNQIAPKPTAENRSSKASPEMQKKRLAFIKKILREEDIFQKVDASGRLPHLWVKPKFYLLSFDEKSKLVNVVWAYYFSEDPSQNILILNDSMNGKEIGQYSEVDGGLKMR